MEGKNVIQEQIETLVSVAIGWLIAWFGYERLFAEVSAITVALDVIFEISMKALIATVSAICAYLGVHYIKKLLKHI